jgi:RNA polymerase sigma factor for flagellar operon FliA
MDSLTAVNGDRARKKARPIQVKMSRPRRGTTKMSSRDQVVLQYFPLVKAIAVRVYENLAVHVDLEDLIRAGGLGLFDAVTKFDPEKHALSPSYVKYCIKGAILDSLRQPDWASCNLRLGQD